MSWVSDTLSEFGRSIGIPNLTLNPQGVASLTFEDTGTLFVEQAGESVLVYLVQKLDYPQTEHYLRSLDLCHWKHNHPFQVNPALRHTDQLVFSVRVHENEFRLPVLEQIVGFLTQLQRDVREGVMN